MGRGGVAVVSGPAAVSTGETPPQAYRLASEWGVSENHRRARFYRLTPEGRKQLDKEAGEFDRLVRAIQMVMRTA